MDGIRQSALRIQRAYLNPSVKLNTRSIRPISSLNPDTLVLNNSDARLYTKQFAYNKYHDSYLQSLRFRKKAASRIRKFKEIIPSKYHLDDYFLFHCLYRWKPSKTIKEHAKRMGLQHMSIDTHNMTTYLRCRDLDPAMEDLYGGDISIDHRRIHGTGMSFFKMAVLEWIFEENRKKLIKRNDNDVIDAMSFNTIQPIEQISSGFRNDKSVLTSKTLLNKFIRQFGIDMSSSTFSAQKNWYKYEESYYNDVRLDTGFLRSILPTYIGFLLYQKGQDITKEFIVQFLIMGRLSTGSSYNHKGLKELAIERIKRNTLIF